MINSIKNGYNWLTARAPWHAARETAAMEERWPEADSWHQKVRIGLSEGLKNFPRALLSTALINSAFMSSLPQKSITEMKDCIEKRGTLPAPLSSFEQILKVCSKATAEEFIFRAGLQNILGTLGTSDSKILRALGSLEGRVAVTTIAFALFHLNNLQEECLPIEYALTQTISNLFTANLSFIYEKGGILASATAHIAHNLIPTVTRLALQTLFSKQ